MRCDGVVQGVVPNQEITVVFQVTLVQGVLMLFLAFLEFGLSERPGMAVTDGSNGLREFCCF